MSMIYPRSPSVQNYSQKRTNIPGLIRSKKRRTIIHRGHVQDIAFFVFSDEYALSAAALQPSDEYGRLCRRNDIGSLLRNGKYRNKFFEIRERKQACLNRNRRGRHHGRSTECQNQWHRRRSHLPGCTSRESVFAESRDQRKTR